MRVVVLEDWNEFFPGSGSLERLRGRAEVQIQHDLPRDQEDVISRLAGAQVVVLNRERTRFDRPVIDALPELELIVQTGNVGPNVDVQAATERGVAVSNAPGLPNAIDGVAELAIGLMISLARRIPANDRNVRSGRWNVAPGVMLNGSTMGIVGLGHLGRSLTRLGRGLQMHVVAAGPTLTPERAAESGVEFSTLDDLFPRADVVFICTKLSDLTRGMVTRRHIESMKHSAFLINTARGPIVDEQALLEALQARNIAGAGLDVFGTEPLPVDHPLLSLDNVVLTPHMGWVTESHTRAYVGSVVESIVRYLEADYSRIVNPEAFVRRNPA